MFAPNTPKIKARVEILYANVWVLYIRSALTSHSPETKFVVFHGDEHNAQPAKLQGTVRLHAPDAMSIKSVKIRLEGKRRIG